MMVIYDYFILFYVEVTSHNSVYEPCCLLQHIKAIIRMFLEHPEVLERQKMVTIGNLNEFKAFKYQLYVTFLIIIKNFL